MLQVSGEDHLICATLHSPVMTFTPVSLDFCRSIADWLKAPDTMFLLDFIKPEFLLLRVRGPAGGRSDLGAHEDLHINTSFWVLFSVLCTQRGCGMCLWFTRALKATWGHYWTTLMYLLANRIQSNFFGQRTMLT